MKRETNDLVCCARCGRFEFFPNDKDHNTPHALGKCVGPESWDGNRGQWPKFFHPCKGFVEKE